MRNGVLPSSGGRDYAKRGSLHRLGAALHEMCVLVLSGVLVTQNEAVCIVCGLGYAKWGVGIVCGRDYAKRGGVRRCGAWLHKMGVLAAYGGLVTRNEAVCIFWGPHYAKWG
jgi:hypothetical protein